MNLSQGSPQVSFTNEGGRTGVQASHYEVHGNNIIQHDKDLLDQLPHAVEAPFNSYRKRHDPTCLPDTRVDLLHKIHSWANGQDERTIFWLSGLAGTGKSTIARTVADTQSQHGRLGASFFFSRGGGDVEHTGKFVTSLACQLAGSIRPLRHYIYDAIRECNDIASRSLREQWHQLILRPLLKLDGTGCKTLYILVVDALDECDDENDIRTIVHLLTEARSLKRVRLRTFLTSRPEIPIRHGFGQIADEEHQDFVLHRISPSIVDHDINIFLEYNLGAIRQGRSLKDSWPGKEVIRQLVQAACGLFIWAATACHFIREGKRFAAKRLDTILKGSGGTVTKPEEHLDKIYTTVLGHSVSSAYTDEEKEESYYMLRQILGSIVILFSPLSTQSLHKLLNLAKEDVVQTLEDLHSVVDIPREHIHPLRLHHPSFRDFLLNNDRCQNLDLWVDEKQAHQNLADSCIWLMSTLLKQDICGVSTPGMLAADMERSQVERSLPHEVQYACVYWTRHVQKSGAQLRDNGPVHQFLQEHLLHWLEALGWMGKTSEGIQAILSLEAYILATKSPNLHAFVYDTRRFALYNRTVIEQSPLQLYCSALVFAPEKSIIRETFKNYIPPWIQRKPRMQAHWGTALQTLEGHSSSVQSVAFSPDGKQVVSGSDDKTVRLWDAVTGKALQTFEGHSKWVQSVAFSPDGKQVVSGSGDKTVRLWDVMTGKALQILEGHSNRIRSVVFSPDGKQMVSGSSDKTVRLWDAVTGKTLQTLEGHSNWVNLVAFSPDGKQVVSGSDDKTVRFWDAVTGKTLQTLEGHSNSVQSIAFSPDGKQVVSGSDDKTVRLWDAVTGKALQTLEGYSDLINSITFSPDGKQMVSGSDDETVRLWDAVTGKALQTLEGHSNWINSVAFSSNGKQVVSGSDDETVRLWDAVTGKALQTLEGHSYSVRSVAFSPDNKQVVSGSDDETVRLWDAVTGKALQTLEGHSYSVRSVAFSPDGKQVVSGSDDETVRLWDVVTGKALQTLEGHSYWVNSVAFSPDGKQVVSGSGDKTVRLWDAITGKILQTLEGYSDSVNSVVFSPDGKQIVSGSGDKTVRLWDAVTGKALQTLEGHSNWVNSVAFSPDGKPTINLVVSNEWVREAHENVLWLPPDYRSTCEAIWNQTVVLAHSSGRLTFLQFKQGPKLIVLD